MLIPVSLKATGAGLPVSARAWEPLIMQESLERFVFSEQTFGLDFIVK